MNKTQIQQALGAFISNLTDAELAQIAAYGGHIGLPAASDLDEFGWADFELLAGQQHSGAAQQSFGNLRVEVEAHQDFEPAELEAGGEDEAITPDRVTALGVANCRKALADAAEGWAEHFLAQIEQTLTEREEG